VTIVGSVRVARQMRDAYGLKPKDRPAMYVKCKVPDFERNVAQVRALVFFLRFQVLIFAPGLGHGQAPCERRKFRDLAGRQARGARSLRSKSCRVSRPFPPLTLVHVSVTTPVDAACAPSEPLASCTCISKVPFSAPNRQPLLRVVNLRTVGLVDVDGELKRLEKQVRLRA
jgi:hypothetical protein